MQSPYQETNLDKYPGSNYASSGQGLVNIGSKTNSPGLQKRLGLKSEANYANGGVGVTYSQVVLGGGYNLAYGQPPLRSINQDYGTKGNSSKTLV